MMMNTCFNSRFHSTPSFVTPYVAIASPSCRRYSDRHRGFSLPEVMVALLLVMLGASTLISTMAAARSRAASNIKFSVAFRLATELSEWTRQGGLRALAAETENSFDLLIASQSELNCFSKPCNAEEASIFFCITGGAGYCSRCTMRVSSSARACLQPARINTSGNVRKSNRAVTRV